MKKQAAASSAANVGDIEMQLVPTTQDKKILIQPCCSWPENGNISFRNVKMRYRDGPLVLKGVSMDIMGGEKVGIAGRTG